MGSADVCVALMLVAFVLWGVAGVRRAAVCGWAAAGAALVARLAATGAVAALVWLAASRADVTVARTARSPDGDAIYFLEDASRSMQFAADGPVTRATLAAQAWDELRGLAGGGDGGTPVAVRRLLFARTLVEERDAARLCADETRLVDAVSSAPGRGGVRALVVVSDGAGTDGDVPQYVRDLARNRDLPVFGVCTDVAGAAMTDVAVAAVECASVNPDAVQVRLTARASDLPVAAVLELTVDGVAAERRPVSLGAAACERLILPVTAQGWHEYAVRVEADAEEITLLNNRACGVFRSMPARRIAFLAGTGRADAAHTAAALRRAWPDRVDVVRPGGADLAGLNVRDVRIVVVAGVPATSFPASLARAVAAGRAALILLAGDGLGEWAGRGSLGLPIECVGEDVAFAGARVVAGPSAGACGLGGLPADGPEVEFVRDAGARPGSAILLGARAGDVERALMVADDASRPSRIVLLTEMSWRWALSPRAAVRAWHARLWGEVLRAISGDDAGSHPLILAFAPDPDDANVVRATVTPGPEFEPEALADVVVDLEGGEASAGAGPEARRCASSPRVWSFDVPAGPRPAVLWFHARARQGGETLSSERTPYVLGGGGMEILDVDAHPDQLRALASTDAYCVPWKGRSRVLRRAVDVARTSAVEHVTVSEKRATRSELLLALAAVVAMGAEWAFERKAGRRRASGFGSRSSGATMGCATAPALAPHPTDRGDAPCGASPLPKPDARRPTPAVAGGTPP